MPPPHSLPPPLSFCSSPRVDDPIPRQTRHMCNFRHVGTQGSGSTRHETKKKRTTTHSSHLFVFVRHWFLQLLSSIHDSVRCSPGSLNTALCTARTVYSNFKPWAICLLALTQLRHFWIHAIQGPETNRGQNQSVHQEPVCPTQDLAGEHYSRGHLSS